MSSGSGQDVQLTNCLIIGDGNFSFSASFAERAKDCKITATSLEARDYVLRHEGAAKNLKLLHENGVSVHHGVDGTRLNAFQEIHGASFGLIIFNFPHTGGKSNIKENRDLVKEFLTSSLQFLDAEGEIWLTLCRGQGGTPDDCLQRGYENSWKVVEQAGGAGLVLTRMRPFCVRDWPPYCPTGYRGCDRLFRTDLALTHVFTKPQPIDDTMATTTSEQPPHLCNTCFKASTTTSVLPFTSKELNYFAYPLLLQEWHPLRRVRDSLTSLLQATSVPNATVEHRAGFSVHKTGSDCIDEHSYNSLYHPLSSTAVASASVMPFICEPCLSCRIRSLELCSSEGASCCTHPGLALSWIVSAPVLGWQQPMNPVSHQLLCYRDSCSSDPLRPAAVVSVLAELVNVSPDVFKWEEIKADSLPAAAAILKRGLQHQYCLLEGQVLGKLCHDGGKTKEFCHQSYCIFYLDAIACVKYGIPDQRLLWSRDRRFSKQFSDETIATAFKPFSLHSPKFVHDVSFWVNVEEYRKVHSNHPTLHGGIKLLVTNELSSILARVASLIVLELRCIDVYIQSKDEERSNNISDRVSFCYRITYNDSSGSLGGNMCNKIQLIVREEISKLRFDLR